MNLIEIDKDVFVNTEKIYGIRVKDTEVGKVVVIYTEGENFISTMNLQELMSQLKSLNENIQFWAGR